MIVMFCERCPSDVLAMGSPRGIALAFELDSPHVWTRWCPTFARLWLTWGSFLDRYA